MLEILAQYALRHWQSAQTHRALVCRTRIRWRVLPFLPTCQLQGMNEVKRIHVAWRNERKGQSKVFGLIEHTERGASFRYILTEEQMRNHGISPLADFPMGKEHTANVLDILSLRLNNPARPDIGKYYDFWEIPPERRADIFYLLAHTQGLLATDNYEFLAEYRLTRDLRFVSEIYASPHANVKPWTASVGDELRWEREPNSNRPNAVSVYKGTQKLGYVRVVHNRVFASKEADGLKARVKCILANKHLNRLFVTIGFW